MSATAPTRAAIADVAHGDQKATSPKENIDRHRARKNQRLLADPVRRPAWVFRSGPAMSKNHQRRCQKAQQRKIIVALAHCIGQSAA